MNRIDSRYFILVKKKRENKSQIKEKQNFKIFPIFSLVKSFKKKE